MIVAPSLEIVVPWSSGQLCKPSDQTGLFVLQGQGFVLCEDGGRKGRQGDGGGPGGFEAAKIPLAQERIIHVRERLTLCPTMSLSIPLGPSVVRMVSVTARQAFMLLTS